MSARKLAPSSPAALLCRETRDARGAVSRGCTEEEGAPYSCAPSRNGFVAVCPNKFAFTALHSDGTLHAWGYGHYGGSGAPDGGGFVSIHSTEGTFAARDEGGQLQTWGNRVVVT